MAAKKANEIFVKGDIIYVICHGKQDKWAVHDTIAVFMEHAEDIRAKDLSVKCIVDLSDDIGYDTEARDIAMKEMKTKAVPTAIIGTNAAMQTVINFMVKVAGQSDKYKAFHTIEEGEAWLKTL
jgi:hypothetical protein